MEFLIDLLVSTGLWDLLANAGLPDVWIHAIAFLVGAFVLGFIPLLAMFFLIWYERKIVARIGDRLGPNNSNPLAAGGWWGLLQVPADAIKMFTKEDVIPAAADRWVFNIAPMVFLATAVLSWAVVPLGYKTAIGADLNIGIFYILSIGSASMVSILMAGWGSNNKYALLGALRGIATLISYEIPQALSVMAVVMIAGSFSMVDIVERQRVAFVIAMPVTALLFLISSLSELGRRPLDLVEANSEIVAGYFIEYSGIKFGMFYLAEFMNQLLVSILFSILFLGGWRLFPGQLDILGVVWFVLKTMLVMLVIQLIQYTLPRLRIDQLLALNWKFLTPLALANICVIALVGQAVLYDAANPWAQAGALLLANVLILLVVMGLLVLAGRRARRRVEAWQAAQVEEEQLAVSG